MTDYHKAVRDKIPEIIGDSGRACNTKILSDGEFLEKLEKKLDEEVCEYMKTKSIEELADILEVVFRIAELKGIDASSLDAIRKDKERRCGIFEKNIFLINADKK